MIGWASNQNENEMKLYMVLLTIPETLWVMVPSFKKFDFETKIG